MSNPGASARTLSGGQLGQVRQGPSVMFVPGNIKADNEKK